MLLIRSTGLFFAPRLLSTAAMRTRELAQRRVISPDQHHVYRSDGVERLAACSDFASRLGQLEIHRTAELSSSVTWRRTKPKWSSTANLEAFRKEHSANCSRVGGISARLACSPSGFRARGVSRHRPLLRPSTCKLRTEEHRLLV